MEPQNPVQLDDSGNPVYEALDDNGNPILHNPAPTNVPEMPDANKMLETGIKTTAKGVGNFWNFLNTPGIPEPTEQEWKEHPYTSPLKWGASQITTPMNMGGEFLKGISAVAGAGALGAGGYLAYRRMKNISKAAEGIAPEVGAIGKEGEDILAETPIRPMFNPKNQIGMTGTKQSKLKLTANTDGTLTDIATGNIFDPKDKTVIIGHTTPENLLNLQEMGFTKTNKVISEGPNKGQTVWIKKDAVPAPEPVNNLKANMPGWKQAYNLSRGTSTTLDLSAPLRQGMPMIHTKQFWTNFGPMLKSLKSDAAFKGILDEINSRPNAFRDFEAVFRGGEWTRKELPSIYDRAGLAITDLANNREENLVGNWVEKALPGARASNRAYTAYLDRVRADTFDSLYNNAKKMYEANKNLTKSDSTFGRWLLTKGDIERINPNSDEFLRQLGQYVNTATGRGSLGEWGEKHAAGLADILFSPRLMASRIKMLNPATYIQANPFIRKQYLKSALATAAAWGTFASLGSMAGGEVSLDPTNADFMKVKIGDNTRIDPGAGFQQFIVAMSKIVAGMATSSTSGVTKNLGEGFNANNPFQVGLEFSLNKLHPTLKYFVDLARATQYSPVNLMDRTLQTYAPLITQDLSDLFKEDKSLMWAIIPSTLGMGTQTYDKGSKTNFLIPEDYDIPIKGRPFQDIPEGISNLLP